MSLSLDRTPAADVIDVTAGTWFEALSSRHRWNEQQDAQRIADAFITLADTCTQWPSPRQFLEALPSPPKEYFTALGTDAGTGKREVPPATRTIIDNLAKHLGVKDGN